MSGRFTSSCRFFPFFAVFVLMLLYPCGLRAGEVPSALIHDPVVAGTWYPGTASELREQIEEYLSRVPERDSKGQTVAIISPHAGYIYSGQVAAHSFKAVQGQKFDSIIVIGPSHYVPIRGVATYDCSGFRTPLGVIPLDSELIAALMKRESRIRDLPGVFRQEHSLEADSLSFRSFYPVSSSFRSLWEIPISLHVAGLQRQ